MKHSEHKATIVDSFGETKAMSAVHKEEEERLRTEIIRWGDGDYNGNLFRVTVRTTEFEGIPNEVLLLKLTSLMEPKRLKRWMKNHTEKGTKTTVRCVARTQEG